MKAIFLNWMPYWKVRKALDPALSGALVGALNGAVSEALAVDLAGTAEEDGAMERAKVPSTTASRTPAWRSAPPSVGQQQEQEDIMEEGGPAASQVAA